MLTLQYHQYASVLKLTVINETFFNENIAIFLPLWGICHRVWECRKQYYINK